MMMTCARTSLRPRRRYSVIFGGVTHNVQHFTLVVFAVTAWGPLTHEALELWPSPPAGRPRLDAGPMPLEAWSYCTCPLGASAPKI